MPEYSLKPNRQDNYVIVLKDGNTLNDNEPLPMEELLVYCEKFHLTIVGRFGAKVWTLPVHAAARLKIQELNAMTMEEMV